MIRVGIADSGVDGPARKSVIARADFGFSGKPGTLQDAPRDRAGHGSAIAAVIAGIEGVELLDARIFDAELRTSAAQAAAAIDWLVTQGARILNLSFGLREDRALLREACARAIDAGVLLVASSPARGASVFPASYPGVLRATGDARCAPGETSWLGTQQADAGAAVRTPCGKVAGASAGCAHVSAALTRLMLQQPSAGREELLDAFRRGAHYHGAERRTQ
jgi:subtilisin family serine protease